MTNDLMKKIMDKETPEYTFFTMKEVCEAFGCKQSTLYVWRKKKGFPPPVEFPGGKGWAVKSLREYLAHTARKNLQMSKEILRMVESF